jgi:hypothetical protein
MSWTIRTSTSLANKSVAQVWRAAWNGVSGSPAFFKKGLERAVHDFRSVKLRTPARGEREIAVPIETAARKLLLVLV